MAKYSEQILKLSNPNNHQKVVRGKIKKIIAGFLIFSQLAFWPGIVLAQAVPSADANAGNNPGGLAGMALNISEIAGLSAPFIAYKACLTKVQVAEQIFVQTNVANSTLAVLSPTGNSTGLAAMEVLNDAYSIFLICANLQLTTLAAAKLAATSLYVSNMKEQDEAQIKSSIATYTKKQGDLVAQIDNANQGFWKTLLISILLQTSKAIADALVTHLVQNYKITNLKQYIDSAATLMYDNQFIRENFPNAQDQLMARAILSNPLFRTQIQPGIFVAANAALGFNPSAINPASPNFYGQMAAMGSPSANPYYLQTAYVGGVNQSRAASLATTQQQISQGSGYKAPVNCAGALTQQKQIDAQAQALEAKMLDRQNVLDNLTAAVQAGKNVPAADLAKAQADVDAATLAWTNAPQALTSSSGSTDTNPAIVLCEAISSPAVLVNQGIDAMFKAVGGDLTQYNSSNLPAFVNIISGIVSQIGTSMVLGGASAGAKTALINENKAVNATVGFIAQGSGNNIATSTLTPQISVSGGLKSQYSMGDQIPISSSNLPTDGTVTFVVNGQNYQDVAADQMSGYTITIDSNFTVGSNTLAAQIYDSNENLVSTVVLGTVNVIEGTMGFNSPSVAPAVAGVFTAKPVIQTRGPATQLNLR